MDAHLRQRLVTLEQSALKAHSTEELLTISRYLEDISDTIANHKAFVAPETIFLAHGVASRISDLFKLLIILEEDVEHLLCDLKKDVQRITRSPMVDDRQSSDTSSHFLSFPAAIDWLLVNLHNPYPSQSIRTALARSAGCTRRVVDRWFSDIRKESGWNRLLKTHFSNKKNIAVEAATQYFVAADHHRPLDLQLQSEFAALTSTTRTLLHREGIIKRNSRRASASSNSSPPSSDACSPSRLVTIEHNETHLTKRKRRSSESRDSPDNSRRVRHKGLTISDMPDPAQSVGPPNIDIPRVENSWHSEVDPSNLLTVYQPFIENPLISTFVGDELGAGPWQAELFDFSVPNWDHSSIHSSPSDTLLSLSDSVRSTPSPLNEPVILQTAQSPKPIQWQEDRIYPKLALPSGNALAQLDSFLSISYNLPGSIEVNDLSFHKDYEDSFLNWPPFVGLGSL